jgi:hypothetical protein
MTSTGSIDTIAAGMRMGMTGARWNEGFMALAPVLTPSLYRFIVSTMAS